MDAAGRESWHAVADAVLAAPGIVMMLGAADVGKTTTATRLAATAVGAGLHTAVVDADIGQSDIGPPATVGWGMVGTPVRHMAEIAPAGLWFVGDTSPQQMYRYVLQGTAELTARARGRGAQVVVVDTTGWVEGAGAVAAKLRKIRRLAPRHIVAIQRDREVEPILARIPDGTTVHRLRPAAAVRIRTAAERRAFRRRQFAGYFAAAHRISVDARRVAFARPALFEGTWVPPSRVLANVPAAALRHLLVGLADSRGTIMSVGTILRVDARLRRLLIMAADVAPDAVRSVAWGMLRVAPSGREEGRLSGMPAVAS
ncbi:MAG TPA: Clp1/GlmU family protein [bacterium]|nr:Clp1/GlmU family protein [bacterium]